MIRINPNKILCGGDTERAKNFIGPANSQMEILKQEMSFQNIQQGIRRVNLGNGIFIECNKFFNNQICKIYAQPLAVSIKDFIDESELIVIISLADGSEAIAWDIINDIIIGEKQTFSELSEFLISENYHPSVELTYTSSWEENLSGPEVYQIVDQDGNIPDTFIGIPWIVIDNKNYNTIAPYNEDLNTWNIDDIISSEDDLIDYMGVYFRLAPNALYSISDDWEIGDYFTFDTVKGSSEIKNISKHGSGALDQTKFFGDILGSITETWTVTIIDSPLGYASNVLNVHISGASVGNVYDSPGGNSTQSAFEDNNIGANYIPSIEPVFNFKYIELPEYTEKPSSYVFSKVESCKIEFWQTEFENSSGYSWPIGLPYITREALFYNPLFGPDFTDDIPFSAQMKAVTINLYDSFIHGDWSQPALWENHYGEIENEYSLSHNRTDTWSTIGVGNSYTKTDESDNTEVKAIVVFDAFCINPYVGGTSKFQVGVNIQYRLNSDESVYEELLDLINLERTNRSLSPLIPNHILQKSALRHAKDMALNKFSGHIGSDGSIDYDRAKDAGYFINRPIPYCYVSENNAVATMDIYSLEDVVQGWMDSPRHRANLLSEHFTETGIVGILGEDNITYFCNVFGGKPGAWGGFGAFDTTNLNVYLNENFTLKPDMPNDFLKVYATQKKD